MTYEIRATGYRHNMAGWCREKTMSLVRGLARSVDAARNIRNLREREKVLDALSSSLNGATKMLAFAIGAEWEASDQALIFDEGVEGYEKILVRCGLMAETAADKKRRLHATFLRDVAAALDGPRTSRTLLHECLTGYKSRSRALKRMAERLEDVTNGELDWPTFVSEARGLFAEFQRDSAEAAPA